MTGYRAARRLSLPETMPAEIRPAGDQPTGNDPLTGRGFQGCSCSRSHPESSGSGSVAVPPVYQPGAVHASKCR